MLQSLFNYDNPVWRFIGKLGDLILLNVLWIICSIPIFTIGASTTAVYYVTLRLVRDEDGQTIRCFFRSFKENFRQSTVIWLLVLLTGIILGFDMYFFLQVMTGDSMFRTVFTAVIGAMIITWFFIVSYIFPVQSRFYNPIKKTIFNAFFMSIRHCFQTIGMLVLDAVILLACYLSLYYAPQFSALGFMFGFPLIAFVNSYFFNRIFKNYIPEEEQEDNGELRPILEDVKLSRPEPAAPSDRAEEPVYTGQAEEEQMQADLPASDADVADGKEAPEGAESPAPDSVSADGEERQG